MQTTKEQVRKWMADQLTEWNKERREMQSAEEIRRDIGWSMVEIGCEIRNRLQ